MTYTTYWKARPFVVTAGRTRTRNLLLVHTLISVPNYDPVFATGLPPETRTLYEHARTTTRSVAELSALSGTPLGVTRVILDDLATADRLLVHPDTYDDPFDRRLLERVRDGLLKIA